MTALRRLSLASLIFATLHVMFGAVVRITGSGFGCGEHWPKCHGYWFPPFNRMDLVIEVMHRYLAFLLSLMVVALLLMAFTRRHAPGVGGRGGVLRPAALAAVLVVVAALFGAVIVRLELANRIVVVVHLALAMALLATLTVASIRAGALGGSSATLPGGTAKASSAATTAAGLAFAVLVMGALTANLPDAASACTGFPHCRNGFGGGPMQFVQLTHRIIAFLLLFHAIGMVMAMRKRGEPATLRRAAAIALAAIVTQILVAAALVETGLPLALRSAHQAVGTLAWIALVALAALARRSSGTAANEVQVLRSAQDDGVSTA